MYGAFMLPLQATSIIRICLAYWVLCRGANLRSEDLDFTEQLLGAQAGQIRMIFKQCSGQDEDLARQLRNALYEGLFYFVIQLANKEVQVSAKRSTKRASIVSVPEYLRFNSKHASPFVFLFGWSCSVPSIRSCP